MLPAGSTPSGRTRIAPPDAVTANTPKRSLTNDLERSPNTPAANAPRTFAPSERAQEPRRWQVDKGMHFWFAREPIGPDGRTITIFPTFADAIAFADRQARS